MGIEYQANVPVILFTKELKQTTRDVVSMSVFNNVATVCVYI